MVGKYLTVSWIIIFILSACSPHKKTKSHVVVSEFDSLQASFYEYPIAGIPVLQQQGLSEVVVFRLYIMGGTQFYDIDEAGIEYLAISSAMQGDTRYHQKEWLDTELQKLSASIQVNSGYDYSVITLKSPQRHAEAAFDILLERFFQPSFNPYRFNKVRDDYAAMRILMDINAQTKLRTWSFAHYYQGTSYAIPPDGSYSTVFNFSNEGSSLYYTQILQKKRLKLLVIGKIGPEIISAKLSSYTENIPEGSFTKKSEYIQVYSKNQGIFQQDSIPNNIIRGIFLAPTSGKQESFAIQLAMSMLADRLDYELVNKGYCQQAYAGYTEFKMPCCAIQMETTVPTAAFKSLMDLLDRIRKEGFTAKELASKKKIFLLKHYQNLQANETRANFIGNLWVLGTWKQNLKLTENIEQLKIEEVNACFKKYCKSIQWYFLGDATKVGRGLFDRQFSN